MLQRLLDCLSLWLIRRAVRRPYAHLVNEDGTPYMDRYWLLRIGGDPDGYPWFGARIHHIRSSDSQHFHDHPWNFFSLILWGGYWEEQPLKHLGSPLFDAELHWDRETRESYVRTWRGRGSWVFRRATTWHRLRLTDMPRNPPAPIEGTWTLFITGRQVQDTWGHLVDGVKVPQRVYRKRIFRDRPKEPATP